MPFDVHNHVIEDISDVICDTIQYCAVMSTTIEEAKILLNLERNENTLIGLGMHPWSITKSSYNELHYTELIESKEFDFIGEIGIDKVATDPTTGLKYDMDTQITIFESLFFLACKYGLPVSIHCARAYGYFDEFFRSLECIDSKISNRSKKKNNFLEYGSSEDDECNENHLKLCTSRLCHQNLKITPKIMLHSYSGSPEITQQFLRLSFSHTLYFSFSAIINRRSMPKFEKSIKCIPLNKLLAETDVSRKNELKVCMDEILNMIANVLTLDIEKVKTICLDNAKAFYGIQ